ncbi:hypothetical protein MWU52_05705 [Jannaschia sp. S6380]|uniref:hypothetical protein n=1 Tax=Jannaschia sp. S6380 TaxID=2926408 RepID=UPI001FF471AF|nr:hypothetical protein [Jannaschia sp. S6380]MCK0167038.1 hypothetical protein [Jannaschia sp. S6380]
MIPAFRPTEPTTEYERELAIFAARKADMERLRLQARPRARWRLWLALRVAGRRRLG